MTRSKRDNIQAHRVEPFRYATQNAHKCHNRLRRRQNESSFLWQHRAQTFEHVANDDIREKHLFCFQLNKSKKGQSGALAFIEFKYSSCIVMYIHVPHHKIAVSVDLI